MYGRVECLPVFFFILLVDRYSGFLKGSGLERHYSDESSKRADSDSHAEMWTDQEQSDTPTAAACQPFFASSPTRPTHEDKTKVFPCYNNAAV